MEVTSFDLIDSFFKKNGIQINLSKFIKQNNFKAKVDINTKEIIHNIIYDSYKCSSENVKTIDKSFKTSFNFYLNRLQKNLLKRYLDYEFDEYFETLFSSLLMNNPDLKKHEVKKLIDSKNKKDYSCVDIYVQRIKTAQLKNDNKLLKDLVNFLYSRTFNLTERRFISINNIFQENKDLIIEESSTTLFEELSKFASQNIEPKPYNDAIKEYVNKYIELLDSEKKESFGLVFLTVNQKTYDLFNDEKTFFSFLFFKIEAIYSKLQNHKTLAIKVDNILSNNINIKWKIYSYLTLFCEKFRYVENSTGFYVPEKVCYDTLSYCDPEFNKTFDEIKKHFKSPESNSIQKIDFFRGFNHGFSFIDCFILCSENNFPQTTELNSINNKTELLLIFNKHLVDMRKIPCPICGSLKISGNSYSEIGIKSWECKNPDCPERSKSNRGKRYSKRTIFMQKAIEDFSPENQIPKNLTMSWRKDVIEKWDYAGLIKMLIKFFSFKDDRLLFLGCVDKETTSIIAKNEKRIIEFSELKEENFNKNYFSEFFNRPFFNLFLNNKKIINKNEITIENNNKVKLIEGDSFEVLSRIKNKIQNMVTSPPYYNAREYSQWNNLFCYLYDMYNIIQQSNRVLSEGGTFIFNIGDIFDNEKTVVVSKMGEKRIPLGAYTILLFERAGFEVLDNIVWYKGEPQSNRHKNDGNFVPYYQRPANAYEHMFVFKKKGKIHKNNYSKVIDNLIRFTPVYKIGKGGINNYGHTAPFPKRVPEISINLFSKEKELILDPFNGSGTTTIVAHQLNRVGIGIELNKEYLELSKQKCREENIPFEQLN